MTVFTFAAVIVILSSGALGGEWVTLSDRAAGVEEDDGAMLTVTCDSESGERALHRDIRGLLLIYFSEPRANWMEYSEIEIVMVSDDSSRTTGRGHGVALSSTDAMLKNDATWVLSVMRKAKHSFTITAGGYTREFSAIKLRETVSSVLERCGDIGNPSPG
jgi:hypothetical protein